MKLKHMITKLVQNLDGPLKPTLLNLRSPTPFFGVPGFVPTPVQKGVDIVSFQDVVHIPIENAIVISVVLVDHLLHPFSTGSLQVGVGDHLYIGVRQKSRQNVRASISDTDSAERDSFTRRDGSVFSEHASREELWNRDGTCYRD